MTCGAHYPRKAEFCPKCAFELATEVDFTPEVKPQFPRRLGDYDLVEIIGHGGAGVVYKARHRTLNRNVAIKMLRSGTLASQAELKRFQAEAQAVAHLHHPNLVPIFEIGESDGQVFLSMEYIHGPSLANLVRDIPLMPSEAARYVQKLGAMMHYAHQSGVIHRDLKPANVLIDERGEPRITDFGLAKQEGHDAAITRSGDILGTPSYMPPEQAEGKKDVGPPSDIYSLGAILYHLLTGRPPFRADTAVDTLRQVIDAEPAPPRLLNRRIPKDLETICLKCLRKRPVDRYLTAQDLEEDLERFLADQPIHAQPVTRLDRLHRWILRNPVGASALMTITSLLLLLAFSAVLSWRDARENSEYSARFAAEQVVKGGLLELFPMLETVLRTPELAKRIKNADQKWLENALASNLAQHTGKTLEWLQLRNLLVIRNDGEPVARWPPNIKPFNRSDRSYFLGAMQRALSGDEAQWVSQVYLSEDDRQFKFGVSKAVRDSDGTVVGVIALMVDTLNFAGALGPAASGRKTVLVAEWDPSSRYLLTNAPARWRRFEKEWDAATTHVLIMHPEFGTNNLAVPLDKRSVERLFPDRRETFQRQGWSVSGYRDPVAKVDARYGGRWVAGVAPIPNTSFHVVFQTQDRFTDALFTSAAIAGGLLVFFGGWLFFQRWPGGKR